jgi:chemotaxis response regulator CheB
MTQFDLVVMIASFGGLGAVCSLLTELPAAFAVLVVQHGRRSEQPDRLSGLVQRFTTRLSGRPAWASASTRRA